MNDVSKRFGSNKIGSESTARQTIASWRTPTLVRRGSSSHRRSWKLGRVSSFRYSYINRVLQQRRRISLANLMRARTAVAFATSV